MCSFPFHCILYERRHLSAGLVPFTDNVLDSGKQLVIKANGIVKKAIEKGAYIDLTVKYGLIRLLTTKADLCEQMGEVDLKCPLEPGERIITKTVELPKEIPPVCHCSRGAKNIVWTGSLTWYCRAPTTWWLMSSLKRASELPASLPLSHSV